MRTHTYICRYIYIHMHIYIYIIIYIINMSIVRFNIYFTEDPSDIYNTHILIQTHMCTIDLHMCVSPLLHASINKN